MPSAEMQARNPRILRKNTCFCCFEQKSPRQWASDAFCNLSAFPARKTQKITMFHCVSEIVRQGDLSSKLEPALGFEPRTDGLQNRSSTAELSRPHCVCWYSVRLPLGHSWYSVRFHSDVAAFNAIPVQKMRLHLIPGNIIWHIFSKSQTLSLYFLHFRGIV